MTTAFRAPSRPTTDRQSAGDDDDAVPLRPSCLSSARHHRGLVVAIGKFVMLPSCVDCLPLSSVRRLIVACRSAGRSHCSSPAVIFVIVVLATLCFLQFVIFVLFSLCFAHQRARPSLPVSCFFLCFLIVFPVAGRILGGTGTGEPVQNKIKYKIQNKKVENTKIAVSILQRNIAKYSTLGGILVKVDSTNDKSKRRFYKAVDDITDRFVFLYGDCLANENMQARDLRIRTMLTHLGQEEYVMEILKGTGVGLLASKP